MKKKNIKQIITYVILVVLLIILAIIGVNNNTENNQTIGTGNSGKYANLHIDNELLNILYFNVGQADSTFITINGQNMLIDAGNNSDGDYIVEFLKSQGINRIDYLIGTHIDEDYIGGMYKIIDALDIGTLYMPYSTADKKCYNNIKDSVNKKGNLEISTIDDLENAKFSLGNATWQVLHVDNTDPKITNDKAINNASIVIKLTYKETNYLFMGDASSKVEEILKVKNIDVLKVAHHGSNESTSEKFLEQITPKYAIISVGNNPNKHPRPEVIQRLKDKSVVIYRTDENGTLWVTTNGEINSIIIKELYNYNLDGANRKISLLYTIFPKFYFRECYA